MSDPGADLFWAWFISNQDRIYNFEQEQEKIFDELSAALAGVSKHLTFEIGPPSAGVRDFVISAGGIREAFPAVERLAAAAPGLPRWRVIKFRPRRTPIMVITYGGLTVDPRDVEFCLLTKEKLIGIEIFFKGYIEAERNRWAPIGYLMLDEALGEYDVETKLSLIKFVSFDEPGMGTRSPLPELPPKFDALYAQLNR